MSSTKSDLESPAAPAFDARELLASLPNRPGVYRMLNASGETLYVGKARDLRKRVSSYFQKTGHAPRTEAMVAHVARVETTVTRSEGEALLLENNLIKAHQPRYNVVFRDDKSYPYVCLTGETFPQLRFHRGKLEKPHRYFGPFPSAGAVRDGMAELQKIFQLRTCEATVFANRSRPCMLYQIQRCSGPCVGLIDEPAYREDVQNATLFLQGKTSEVLAHLQGQMEDAAASLAFERAAKIRDKITRMQQLQSRQFVESATAGDIDVVGAAAESGLIAVNLVMIRGGRHVGDRTFFPQHAEGASTSEIVAAFLMQHYLELPAPPTIIALDAADSELLAEVLSAQSGRTVEIATNPGGERRVWMTMAVQNAKFAIRQKLAQKATQDQRLAALQEALELLPSAQRIECFDVSHTMGEAAVASCVIFDRLAMQSSEYRRFNVKPPTGGDDYAAMHEALTRRVARIVAGEYPAPDLGRSSGIAPAPADTRRGAPLRDPGPSRPARQGAHDLVAAGDRRDRVQAPPGAARALRRTQGRAGGERRRSGKGAGDQPGAGGAYLCHAALSRAARGTSQT